VGCWAGGSAIQIRETTAYTMDDSVKIPIRKQIVIQRQHKKQELILIDDTLVREWRYCSTSIIMLTN